MTSDIFVPLLSLVLIGIVLAVALLVPLKTKRDAPPSVDTASGELPREE